MLEALSECGVKRIEYVAAFPDLDGLAVCLCTDTDAERDRLGTSSPALADVQRVLREVGFQDSDIGQVLTTAQSQETIDREYDGKWFYALR